MNAALAIPVRLFRGPFLQWLSLLLLLTVILSTSCKKEDEEVTPVFFLKTGVLYTADGASIPLGGQIRIGLIAGGAGSPITYIRIDRVTGSDTVVELDRGTYIGESGLDEDFTFSKDTAQQETWVVTLMNADRKEASQQFRVFRGQGTAFGDIRFFPSITIGHQENTDLPHYLDADLGLAYDQNTVSGHEAGIDIVCYFYLTSGKNSPTLTCPGYTASIGYYPLISSWTVRNNTLYDYYSTDNDLVSLDQFESADNDSLLVSAFKPGSVSGNCKFCYTGKVIPFKTQQGKYGLIRVLRADESAGGSMELAIKVQE